MAALVIIILLLALLGILGAVIEGLFWLLVAAVIAMAVVAALGWWKFRRWRTQ